MAKWGGFNSDNAHIQEKLRDELVKNKDLAFQYMMPKETSELESKREELAFFTNQSWDEVKRIGNDNSKLLRDHFKDMASLQCSYINQVFFFSYFAEPRYVG